ncbi:hypothetical protein [Methanotorris formicicus]|uniref:DUF5673 domain-containing protein n=1 Tax=Methanotorris formicicus Mc-S-70 TaxID=647171 RepID=H1KZW8_9EURY|nr:hypothetical protein [Methanotorris formicicus]EHP85471.1 hypothetical protein MetfoDRAFT_1342 [Methanotorris formicicus Mc-S-70]
MDKGKKLLETRQKPFDTLKKEIRIGILSIFGLLILITIIEFITNRHIFYTFSVIIMYMFLFFIPRKYTFYEKGISIGTKFISWDDVEGVEYYKDMVKIRTKVRDGIIKIRTEINLIDRDGRVKEIIKNCVNPNQ